MEGFSASQDKFADVGGLRIRYWEGGQGDVPVILVHGLGGYIECWGPAWNYISKKHRTLALDLPGFGLSDKPADAEYGYEFFAGCLKNFMDAFEIPKAVLVGWSLGGGSVLRFAVDNPERVEKLVLLGSGGLGRGFSLGLRLLTIPGLGERLVRMQRETAHLAIEGMVFDKGLVRPEWADLFFNMNGNPGVERAILATVRNGSTIFGGTMKVLGPIFSGLHRITAPALLIWGKQDRVIPWRSSRRAQRSMPHARVVVLDRCGHIPHLEQVETVRGLMLDFISG